MPEEVSIYKGAFRVKDWWWSKAALLMGMVYLLTLWFSISFDKFVPLALLSLCTIIGFASFGYLSNDLFDIRQDILSGKRNFLIGRSPLIIAILFVFSLTIIFAPWLFLPADKFSFSLIALQLLLFLIYSAPPIRLKERGAAGIVIDSLYAHAVPPILAAYTFSLAAHVPLPGWGLVLLFAWQFTSGVRNIIMHQYEDAAADKMSGAKNFVAAMPQKGFLFAMKYLIIMELVLSLSFFAYLGINNRLFLFCAFMIFIFSVIVAIRFYSGGVWQILLSKWRYFPNNIYERWLPPFYLILCCLSNYAFTIVLIMHLALFNFDVYGQVGKRAYLLSKSGYYGVLIPVRIAAFAVGSAMINYSIYYILLLFGINLKKENTSALSYFKKKWGKN